MNSFSISMNNLAQKFAKDPAGISRNASGFRIPISAMKISESCGSEFCPVWIIRWSKAISNFSRMQESRMSSGLVPTIVVILDCFITDSLSYRPGIQVSPGSNQQLDSHLAALCYENYKTDLHLQIPDLFQNKFGNQAIWRLGEL